jgi:large subunit ribosomal protein L53
MLCYGSVANNVVCVEDGKEMNIDCEKTEIKSIIEEVDRHSRVLQKQADLTDG